MPSTFDSTPDSALCRYGLFMLRLTRLICLQEPRRPFAGRRRIAAAGVLTYHSSSSSAAIFSCRASPPNARPPSAMDSSAIHGTGSPAAAEGMQPGPTISSESSAGGTGKVPAAGIEEGAAADAPPEGAGEARPVPEEILKSAVHLQCDSSADGGVCDVYLVGTAHVSKVVFFVLFSFIFFSFSRRLD